MEAEIIEVRNLPDSSEVIEVEAEEIPHEETEIEIAIRRMFTPNSDMGNSMSIILIRVGSLFEEEI